MPIQKWDCQPVKVDIKRLQVLEEYIVSQYAHGWEISAVIPLPDDYQLLVFKRPKE